MMLPTPEDVANGTTIVAMLGIADSMGKSPFFAYWYDAKTPSEGGPPNHVRGQRFHANIADFVARSAKDGQTVKPFNETSQRLIAEALAAAERA